MNGDSANKKTTTIDIVPDIPFSLTSSIAHPAVSTIGSPSTIDIVVKDKYGNNYIEEIAPIFY